MRQSVPRIYFLHSVINYKPNGRITFAKQMCLLYFLVFIVTQSFNRENFNKILIISFINDYIHNSKVRNNIMMYLT